MPSYTAYGLRARDAVEAIRRYAAQHPHKIERECVRLAEELNVEYMFVHGHLARARRNRAKQ